MILTNTQAEAVANAFAHLNNVGGRLHARIATHDPRTVIHVAEGPDDRISVYSGDRIGNPCGPHEAYKSQAAFTAAYGID